jgi:hypothetical protein
MLYNLFIYFFESTLLHICCHRCADSGTVNRLSGSENNTKQNTRNKHTKQRAN